MSSIIPDVDLHCLLHLSASCSPPFQVLSGLRFHFVVVASLFSLSLPSTQSTQQHLPCVPVLLGLFIYLVLSCPHLFGFSHTRAQPSTTSIRCAACCCCGLHVCLTLSLYVPSSSCLPLSFLLLLIRAQQSTTSIICPACCCALPVIVDDGVPVAIVVVVLGVVVGRDE